MGYNREVPVNAPCKVIPTVTRKDQPETTVNIKGLEELEQ